MLTIDDANLFQIYHYFTIREGEETIRPVCKQWKKLWDHNKNWNKFFPLETLNLGFEGNYWIKELLQKGVKDLNLIEKYSSQCPLELIEAIGFNVIGQLSEIKSSPDDLILQFENLITKINLNMVTLFVENLEPDDSLKEKYKISPNALYNDLYDVAIKALSLCKNDDKFLISGSLYSADPLMKEYVLKNFVHLTDKQKNELYEDLRASFNLLYNLKNNIDDLKSGKQISYNSDLENLFSEKTTFMKKLNYLINKYNNDKDSKNVISRNNSNKTNEEITDNILTKIFKKIFKEYGWQIKELKAIKNEYFFGNTPYLSKETVEQMASELFNDSNKKLNSDIEEIRILSYSSESDNDNSEIEDTILL